MDIGKLQFKLADHRYFVLLRKCSLNITEGWNLETSELSPWNAKEAFLLRPQDSSNNSPNFMLFSSSNFSSDNFLLNQTSSFINILQIIDRKLIFDKVFAPTTDTKALRAHLANIVDPFQSSWTNGKRFAYVSIVQRGSEVPSYTKIISLLKRSVFFETGC